LPDPLIRIIGCAGEGFDLLCHGGTSARVCLETALQAGRRQFFSNAKARHELGWNPLESIQESIAEAVAWFRGSETEVELAPAAPSVESHVR
jgi:nucleoside-diphosphate-sugar epimerase